MPYICPPKEEAENRMKTLITLKELIRQVEEESHIPIECPHKQQQQQQLACNCIQQQQPTEMTPNNPPDVMVCYRTIHPKGKERAPVKKAPPAPAASRGVKPSKSRELRASILYTGCDCERRNGLQDDCLRSECHGSPSCLTDPPTCGPSRYSNGKHLKVKGKRKEANGGDGEDGEQKAVEEYTCFPAVMACCEKCSPKKV